MKNHTNHCLIVTTGRCDCKSEEWKDGYLQGWIARGQAMDIPLHPLQEQE